MDRFGKWINRQLGRIREGVHLVDIKIPRSKSNTKMAHLLPNRVDDSQSVASQGTTTTMAAMQGTTRRRNHRLAERHRRSLCASTLLSLVVILTCLQFVRVGGDDPSKLENKDEASGGGVKIKPPPADDGSNQNNDGDSYASATLQKLASAEAGKVIGSTSADATTTGSASTLKSEQQQQQQQQQRSKVDPLSVVVLTSRNFESMVGDGSVWLVEFYAPWCSHCRHFESTYDEIAAHFHRDDPTKTSKGKKKAVRVAKVDGDSERALSSRFGVHGYPSFFVVEGWTVYAFQSSRSKHNLIKFADQGYKSADPIPFYSSPMGPLGLAQGALMAAGVAVADQFERLQHTFGLSPLFAGAVLFGITFMGCFCLLVVLVVVITPKSKID
jgi:thiol-disulfide isomerase/thioredoxin